MKLTTRSRINAIVAAHESEIEREQDRIDQAHREEVLFEQQFQAWKKNVAVPGFLEVQTELKRHGHECKVIETDKFESGDAAGDSVRGEFYPKGWDYGSGGTLGGPPSLTVAYEPSSRSVKLVECTFGPLDNGWEGELGAFNMEEITRDMMAEVFVALVEKILLDKSFIAKSTKSLHPSWTGPGMRVSNQPRIGRSRHAA